MQCADRVSVRVGSASLPVDFCAPSLFVAGVGKCGTNALSEYLGMHPRVARINKELAWDPNETPPAKLVRERRATPRDVRAVWVAKHPKYSVMRPGAQLPTSIAMLASRLRAAYPHSRLALTLCEPSSLPWRRFLFLLTSALTLHGTGAGSHATSSALAAALRQQNSSVAELFAAVFNPARPKAGKATPPCDTQAIRGEGTSEPHCRHDSPRTRALLGALESQGFGTLYDNGWLRISDGASEVRCKQEWQLASSYVDQVEAWVSALGAVNQSVGVVYMEGWRTHGAEYMRVLLRMLGLSEAEYPWHKASFSTPVYTNTMKRTVLGGGEERLSSRSAGLVPAERACVRSQCERLTRVTGMRPPWCDFGDM